jgi:hypothetical protein
MTIRPTTIRAIDIKNYLLTSHRYTDAIGVSAGRFKKQSAYKITTDEPIQALRVMWKSAKCDFIRKVIAEMGSKKFYTDKQVEMVTKHFVDSEIMIEFTKFYIPK